MSNDHRCCAAGGNRRRPPAQAAAISLWYEEIILFAEEIFTLISIVLLAGVIYLLNFILFKTQMPRKED